MCEDKASYLAVASLWHNCAPLAQPLCANRSEASKQLRPGLVSDSLEALKWTKQTLISLSLHLSRPLLHREEGRAREMNWKRRDQAILTKCVKYDDAGTSAQHRRWHMPFAKRKSWRNERGWAMQGKDEGGNNRLKPIRYTFKFSLSNTPWLSD